MSRLASATNNITKLAEQINNTTDCSALSLIFEQHLSSVTDLIEAKLESQLEILKNYLPLLSLPGANPAAIVKWLKKLLMGSILPQLKAYINLIIQIAELQKSLQELITAIENADDRLKNCLETAVIDATKFRLQTKISELTQPLQDGLNTVATLENQIKSVIDNPTDPYIVTSSLEGFLETVDSGFAQLGIDVEEFNDSEIESSPTFSGNVVTAEATFVIEGGLIVDAQANTG